MAAARAAGNAARPRRTYRWLTPARTVALASLVSVFCQVALALSLPESERNSLLSWAVPAVLLSLCQGARLRPWFLVPLVLVQLATLNSDWQILASRPSIHPLGELLAVATTGLSLVVAALVSFRAPPDKSILAVVSLGIALVAAELFTQSSLAGRGLNQPSSTAPRSPSGLASVAPVFADQSRRLADMRTLPFPVDELIVGGRHADAERTYTMEPGGWTRHLYPDNPRGYFREFTPTELRLRSLWQVTGEPSLTLQPLDDSGRAIRVTPHRLVTPAPYDVQISRPGFLMAATTEARVRLRARSEAPLTMRIGWLAIGEAVEALCEKQEFPVTTTWQDYAFDFRPRGSSAPVSLILEFPRGEQNLELAGLEVWLDGQLAEPTLKRPTLGYYIDYRMNAQGFRDDESQIPRPDDLFRIVCLGDSYTFGQGVHREDTVSEQLEAQLNRRAKRQGAGPRFEVINCGACGYGTHEERMTYELAARSYQPQLVLVLMVYNDDRSWIDEQNQLAALTEGGLLNKLRSAGATGIERHYSNCTAELAKLHEACRADGAHLVLAVFRHHPLTKDGEWEQMIETVSPFAAQHSIPFTDLGDAIIQDHNFDELEVHLSGDHHPNELAHHLAAEALEKLLIDNHLVPLAP